MIEADTVQLDEASIVGFPQDAPWAADAINHALAGILNEKAVHICFGNYGGQPMLRGFWRDLIPFLNSLETDHLVLEFARRGYEELSAFNDLNPKIGLGIGVIDIKDNEVESRELIASRIEKIAKTIGAERLHYVHPDCGFWMLQRSVVDRKMRALVEGRDLFEGRSRDFLFWAFDYVRKVGALTVEDEKAAVRTTIFNHLAGIALAPTVAALADRGVFRLFDTSAAWITLEEIAERTHANRGYMRVALRLLASCGWLQQRTEASGGSFSYALTPEGVIGVRLGTPLYREVISFIPKALFLEDFLYGKFDGPLLPSLQALVQRARAGWFTTPQDDPVGAKMWCQSFAGIWTAC